VTVRLRKSEAKAILTVKDTGIGMSPDFMSRIRSRQFGFQAHLVKPVMANDPVTTIVGLVKPASI